MEMEIPQNTQPQNAPLTKPTFPNFLNHPLSALQIVVILGSSLVIFGAIVGWVYFSWSSTTTPATIAVLPRIPKKSLTLVLASPNDGDVVSGDEITVRGKTLPNTTVVFYTETDDNSVESDANGQFDGTIKLGSGINTLTVSAFAENGEEQTTSLDIVNDNQVKGVKTQKDANEPPGQAKKEEMQQKAIVGGIEQVTTNSVTVGKGKLKQNVETMVDKNTLIFNQENKLIKLNTLKQNDKAAVIATDSAEATPGGLAKKALKIFVRQATSSAALRQMKRQAVEGVITNISGNTITLTHQIKRDRVYTLLVSPQTVVKIKGVVNGTITDLAMGQRITAVGDLNDNGMLVATRIHLIPGKATGIFQKYPISTPSASLTATPTATVSVTPLPTGVTPTGTLPTPTVSNPSPTTSL